MKGLITPLFYAERLPFYGRLRLLYLGSLSSLNVNSRSFLAKNSEEEKVRIIVLQ